MSKFDASLTINWGRGEEVNSFGTQPKEMSDLQFYQEARARLAEVLLEITSKVKTLEQENAENP
mgnify:CR=1 FL=1